MIQHFKKSRSIICLIIMMAFVPQFVIADNPNREKPKIRWTKRPSGRTGLYTVKNSSIAQGISLSINALYYYGDVDRNGIAFNGGFQTQNLSIGGSAAFAYSMPMGRYFNWRFSLGVGALRGDNSKSEEAYSAKKFNNIFGELAAGIEYYPFTKAGFYIYAGIALNYAHIKYNYTVASGTADNFTPMIPIELGYDFHLSQSWMIRLSASVHQAVIDAPHMNLDGYPMNSEQNSSKIDFGRGGGNKWADGYFQLGLTVTYRWKNCERCRIYK